MELIRSVIFVPGNQTKMLERALAFNADVILVDLEDSVPPSEKVNAREMARDWVPRLQREGRRVMVRVNALDTGLTRDEVAAVMGPDLNGVSVGKIESPWDVREADRIITALESSAGLEPGHIKLIPWIETARAVMAVQQIALASPRIIALAFGAEDYTNDMGIQRSDASEETYFARSLVPIAARAAGVASLDSPFVQFRDPEALRRDLQVVRQMGYSGKFAIHPNQLDIINEMLGPQPEEVEYARRVMDAWDRAEAAGRGSIDLDGRMVDVPVVKRAQNLLAFAEAIARQGLS
ncbi:MAG: CoA ester lyase [Dehalococcoidia bacterium]|nr:CoA ester lyase [Dehalococcoidia bacterium]MDP7199385.1 CoA ester lyase [Dehalococcoidia bacterium]HJN86138.1 CoA ester lyase [Dehalococcoidia bacterium]